MSDGALRAHQRREVGFLSTGRGRGSLLMLACLMGTAACGVSDPPDIDPQDLVLDGSYTMQACAYMSSPLHTPPCTVYNTPSHNDDVDSSRVLFRPDLTVQWMVGRTIRANPCSGPQHCWSTSIAIDTIHGTYLVGGDSVVAHFDRTLFAKKRLVMKTMQPVQSGWSGPDSLVLDLSDSQRRIWVFRR